jgi:outer membrane receptor protein involved in Fe transport
MPLGNNTSFNQVLLQAPGVAQDQYGQLHIRGDHADLQYRINGVIIPESISFFGQTLDPRFFSEVNLLTGALPAEYGDRTAGIVDIHTKSGTMDTGGEVTMLAGSYDTLNPSIEYGGTKGNLDYYFTGQFMHNDLGIDSPTPAKNALHDATDQEKGFGYLSYLLSDQSRVTLMFGTAVNNFQIPDNPNQTPVYPLNGASYFPNLPSADLNETQREVTDYTVLAYQSKVGTDTDYQVSLFSRYSQVQFNPDILGDLIYNGIASDVYNSNINDGLQCDASTRLNDAHTLRYGISGSEEHAITDNNSLVFQTNSAGTQLPGGAVQIIDNNAKNGNLLSAYLQDEWLMTSALTVNYGVRADRYNAYVDDGQISPRFGLVYKSAPDTTWHLGYARYFTPPATELVAAKDLALFQNTTNAAQVDEASPVKPERDNYYDVGVSHTVLPGWTSGLDGYYKQAKDLLDLGQFGTALVFAPFNYNTGKVFGAEFTNSYRNGPFGAYLNVAWSHAEATQIVTAQYNFSPVELSYINTHEVYLDHDQRVSASSGVSYLWGKTTMSADAIFGTGLRAGFANTEQVPAYTTVNLGLARDFNMASIGLVNVRLSAINIFDRVYEIRTGTGIGVGEPSYGERRALYAALSKPF